MKKMFGKHSRQLSVYFISLAGSLLFGILNSALNTRLLGPDSFGEFKFIQTIWGTSILFFTMGFFITGGNLLAAEQDPKRMQSLTSGVIVLAVGISIIFCISIFCLSFPFGVIFNNQLAMYLRYFACVLFVFPFIKLFESVLRGSNQIYRLAFLNTGPQIIYFGMSLTLSRFIPFSTPIALSIYISGFVIVIFCLLYLSHPNFTNVRIAVQEILSNNYKIGFPIFIAVLIGTASDKISLFALAYFFDTKLVGFFALTLTVTVPLTMMPKAVATTFFKEFSQSEHIHFKIFLLVIILSTIIFLIYTSLIKLLIHRLYGVEYLVILPSVYICSLGSLLHGIGDVFNRFLLSHNKTNWLRTSAMLIGLANIIFYPVTIFCFHLIGAAVAKILIDVFYLFLMSYYYVYLQKTADVT